ncbi:Peptidoglycan/LPS O-acetylase OafA/YrhL, contains acyltransferase and SGNH-hydrolase domains [Rhodoblastus acidophilus]|uniref:Peptidoglycan/LPS O-acetylase OafA/YrhL, contains acyltransferase and SGNH-hydrolase domains n=1 Tax=Rhodoblastus acidophilus TaxID=1074 RepID=A0A212R8C9_RHOAC|nr:Peptidoglycan/LPS O-acetylase OafA/YrhL, contains acyltransferase and SGNH-hydrolase domains [Rhodoblastus acidophilus]
MAGGDVTKQRNEGGADRIEVLDGWRAISVGLVLVAHLLGHSSVKLPDLFGAPALATFDPLARLGVDIFFVISGFVICRGLMRERRETGRISLPAFYARRVFRIGPPLVAYLACVALLAWMGAVEIHGYGPLARALTFTCNIANADCGGWLGGHTWSLSVEEQFYLVIPSFLVLLAQNRPAALAMLIVFCLLGLVFSAFDILIQFVFIGAGVALALNEDSARRAVRLLPNWAGYALLAAAPALAWARHAGYELAGLAIVAVIPTLLMWTMLSPSRWRDVLLSPPLQATGRVSYGVYLWQQLATYPFAGAGALFYLGAVAGCLAWSLVSFHWIETPLIDFGARLSRRLKQAQASNFSCAPALPRTQ